MGAAAERAESQHHIVTGSYGSLGSSCTVLTACTVPVGGGLVGDMCSQLLLAELWESRLYCSMPT